MHLHPRLCRYGTCALAQVRACVHLCTRHARAQRVSEIFEKTLDAHNRTHTVCFSAIMTGPVCLMRAGANDLLQEGDEEESEQPRTVIASRSTCIASSLDAGTRSTQCRRGRRVLGD